MFYFENYDSIEYNFSTLIFWFRYYSFVLLNSDKQLQSRVVS